MGRRPKISLLMLTDDVILYVAETLHKEPLFGLLAVAALHRSQRRLQTLLHALVKEQPAILDRSCDVTYTWNVSDFSKFQTMPADTKVYSPEFSTALGHTFRFILYPNGNKVQYLSLYLEVPVYSELSCWHRRAKIALRVAHPEGALYDIKEQRTALFSRGNRDLGYRYLIDLEDVAAMLFDDALRVTAYVTVEPPQLDFGTMSTLWAYREKEDYVLRSLMPSMLRDLKKAFESTDLPHPWSLCPSCGERLTPPPCAAAAGMAQTRMQCSTVDCAGCPAAASHALLRRFVDDRSRDGSKKTWLYWPWPLGDLAVSKPEHFLIRFISSETMRRLANDRLRDAAAEHFSRNLDAVL